MLGALPRRLDTRLPFPSPTGELYDLRNFRRRELCLLAMQLGSPRARRADDGTRTHDTWLGKPVLYQLSYVRET